MEPSTPWPPMGGAVGPSTLRQRYEKFPHASSAYVIDSRLHILWVRETHVEGHLLLDECLGSHNCCLHLAVKWRRLP